MFFLLLGNLARSVVKTPSAIIELILLGALLFFALLYAIQNYTIKKSSTILFLLFLLYLLLHTISASIMRPFILGTSFFETLKFNLLEFRISTLSYFLPLIFIPLTKINIKKLESFIYILFKVSIGYTIFEQSMSLIGFRTFFESLYMNSGVVTGNQIGAKSLGMYRIWGLVGSPQLLGVFHIMTLFFMLYKNDSFWARLSFLAIIFSTSKTAYLILIATGFLYLIYQRKYALLILSVIIFLIATTLLFNFYFYLIDSHTHEYPAFRKFMGSIIGYIMLMYNTLEPGQAAGGFIEGGPLYRLILYYDTNPLELFLGKGITYSFMQDNLISDSPFSKYLYLTSDFYILTYFEQYGIIGMLLLSYIFLFYPFIKIVTEKNYLNFIPVVFFISMFHYPPQISKLMMLVAAYPLWNIYLNQYEHEKG
tara:strand:- start:196 stop:1464 length:1269 start_codon:yes stop_codon:yes gene_type:complete